MNYSLMDYINAKTNNEFSFLKLSEVVYFQNEPKCIVSFIYDEDLPNLTEEQKQKISMLVEKNLELTSPIEVKIRKAYLDENLIYKFVVNYFATNHTSIKDNFNQKTVQVTKQNKQVKINFVLDDFVTDYFEKKDIKNDLISKLNLNFCGSFLISIDTYNLDSKEYDEFLKERQRRVEEISVATAYVNNLNRRFKVVNKQTLIGEDVDVDPEHIILKEATNRVFAGKVKFLTMKTYKSKRLVKGPDGEKVPMEKQYFNFVLQDGALNIHCVCFPNKASLHKMNLLSDGSTVVVRGDVEVFNERYSLRVKDLSLCEISDDIVYDTQFKKETTDYNFVKPQPYESASQSNLFETLKTEINPKAVGKSFVVFDLETTGLDFEKDEIIEIGAVKIIDGVIKETFWCFVKPSKPIPAEASAINNITNEMVASANTINQVLPDFFKFTRGAALVGHNAIEFDCKFIDANAKRLGYNFDNPKYDTLMMARAKLSNLRHHNLKTVCGYLGISLVGAHRAINDTVATAEVFLKLL